MFEDKLIDKSKSSVNSIELNKNYISPDSHLYLRYNKSDYIDTNVSTKVVKLIQSYTGVVDKMVWRKY